MLFHSVNFGAQGVDLEGAFASEKALFFGSPLCPNRMSMENTTNYCIFKLRYRSILPEQAHRKQRPIAISQKLVRLVNYPGINATLSRSNAGSGLVLKEHFSTSRQKGSIMHGSYWRIS